MRRVVRDNGLSLAFTGMFLLTLAGQSLVGHAQRNEELAGHGAAAEPYLRYVSSSAFVVDVAENWQSEFLQFFMFILATVWLVQRGSPESKQPGDEGLGTDEEQLIGEYARDDSPAWARVRGLRLWLLSNSLLLVMGTIFLLSWLAQALAGHRVANQESALHGEPAPSLAQYVASPEFWNRTLQNWQSEFLAVAAMVTFSIYLRQRGSSESKPVGIPHHTTSVVAE
ncbi:hypothetical protein GCM10009751_25220 [Myceligenerans crystallogenes]|uniref:Transmembrane protein n=1 Tax=Myceligenerans crystallogenes TaxID=316335 RepID=A0ABN2NF14_9MICO